MKILHLEDNATDAELMHLTFREEWPDCDIHLVDTRAAFIGELMRGGHDLILSDFNLMNFNGLEALKLARERTETVPFIFISGTIGEDRAIEALRSGASDYVIKDRPKRLIPAMKRALENAQQIRQRKAAEEQLLRVQRLENIGMLAAGIAHDFNNVLAPVLMAVPLLRDRLNEPMDRKILANVESSVERGAGLVRQILGFAQGVTGAPQLLQPKHVLRDLLGVMRQTFPKSIQIEDSHDRELWPLKANPTQLHQVLLNLCVNARDAMPDGGTLHLRAMNRELDEVSASGIPGARPGPYLLFEVADTGTGMPPEVQSRIWDPFFTTKEAGRGTGLGLPTVRGIVENHQGVIVLNSRVGHGTTFQVYLPATPGVELVPEAPNDQATPTGRGELILVVDDDENVRDVTSAMLVRNGYQVIAAANGTEAVALFAPRSLEVKVVVTDLSMPFLDGIALSRVVQSLNPSTRILVISGVPDAEERLRGQQFYDPFLTKPFTAEKLLGAIREVLAKSRSKPATA
jgi:two-component system cell cycle sensor histidine kinase/response regulator CckA